MINYNQLEKEVIIKFNLCEITRYNIVEFKDFFEENIPEFENTLIKIDMDNITFLDSESISFCINMIREYLKKENSLIIYNINEYYFNIFKLLGLLDIDINLKFEVKK